MTTRRASIVAVDTIPRILMIAVASTACYDFTECTDVAADTMAVLPQFLSETGLYEDITEDVLAPGVRPFTPQFALWSDGAEKRRFIALPEGTKIDSSDPDFWQFPVGTKIWKEFTRDGVRVEMRLLQRIGPKPKDWVAVAYAWRKDGSDAKAAPYGAVNALGTPHDLPSASQCWGCHGGVKNGVLGFSAIQLAHEAKNDGELTLDRLIDLDLLSDPPRRPIAVPGNDVERRALGYLHANCGHCHNRDRPSRSGPRCYDPWNDLDFLLRVDRLDGVRSTPTYRTAVGGIIEPGRPRDSRLIDLISRDAGDLGLRMPPLGRDEVDREALALLRTWIERMDDR